MLPIFVVSATTANVRKVGQEAWSEYGVRFGYIALVEGQVTKESP